MVAAAHRGDTTTNKQGGRRRAGMTRSQQHLLFLLALPLRLVAVWAPERHRLRCVHVAQASQHPAADPVPDGQQIGDDDLRYGGERERCMREGETLGETLRAMAGNDSSEVRTYIHEPCPPC